MKSSLYPKRIIISLSLVALTILIYMFFATFTEPKPEKDLRSSYLEGGDFQLLRNDTPFSLSELKGHPVIIYFGYTYCPDVCPVGLAVIRDVLKSEKAFENVSALFVTVDPERDTAEKLEEYAAFFHSNIIPLHGSVTQIQEVIEAYGGFFRKIMPEQTEKNNYLVDHSAYYYLIGSNGELMRVLDHSVSASALADALRSLL